MNMFVKLARAYGTNLTLLDEGKPYQGSDICSKCKNQGSLPGNAHIKCEKPPLEMSALRHGADEGWFMFPLLFDPTWRLSPCSNFESVEPVNHAVASSSQSDKSTAA